MCAFVYFVSQIIHLWDSDRADWYDCRISRLSSATTPTILDSFLDTFLSTGLWKFLQKLKFKFSWTPLDICDNIQIPTSASFSQPRPDILLDVLKPVFLPGFGEKVLKSPFRDLLKSWRKQLQTETAWGIT